MKRLPLLFALLTFYPAGRAFSSDITWLRPGARANAMGSAFSTVEGDAYSVFYNPADLTTLGNVEAHFETGRRLSPAAREGEASIAYIRPQPDNANRTVGFGYYAVRRGGDLSADSAVFSMGDRTVIKYFQQPLFYGAGVRLVNLRSPERSNFGLGFDAGLQLGSDTGLKTALVLTDAVFGLGRSLTTLTLGNSYRSGNTLFLADLRTRGAYSELFFGAEHTLFNGLAQARAGKGISLDGGRYMALGLGVNALPWIIDLAWSLPWKGYNASAGYYGFTIGRRFGGRTFSDMLAGDAARQVETNKTELAELRAQRAALESSITAYRVNKSVMETDLTLMNGRIREMETTIKDLELRTLEAQYKNENPQPAKRYVPAPPVRWPKLHKTAPGETLRSIASKYYGNPNLWERIYEANEKSVSRGLPVEGAVFTIPAPPPSGK